MSLQTWHYVALVVADILAVPIVVGALISSLLAYKATSRIEVSKAQKKSVAGLETEMIGLRDLVDALQKRQSAREGNERRRSQRESQPQPSNGPSQRQDPLEALFER